MRNRPAFFQIALFALLLYSCSKNTEPDPTPTPEPPKKNLRVAKVIYTYASPGGNVIDTLSYTYDGEERVTSRTQASSGYSELYRYTDGKVNFIGYIAGTNEKNNLKEAVYSANGDTILVDFSRPNTSGGIDTVQLWRIFKNEMLVGVWQYISTPWGPAFDKETLIYNASGNLTSTTFTDLLTPLKTSVTVTAWDDKINPQHGQPKLNLLFRHLYMPITSSSVHNPTKYTDYWGDHEVEMTYNDQGYPLTYKLKEETFIRSQLIYEEY